MISSKKTCFFCSKKIKAKEAFKVNMETGEGLHKVHACEECGQNLNEILKALEEIREEERV